MIDKNDWRLTNQMDFLYGKQLKHAHFTKRSDSWEHEHCAFCNEKFYHEEQLGYCTMDNYHWICEKCFEDFKDMFNWQVENGAKDLNESWTKWNPANAAAGRTSSPTSFRI